jgi:hypothetical protein
MKLYRNKILALTLGFTLSGCGDDRGGGGNSYNFEAEVDVVLADSARFLSQASNSVQKFMQDNIGVLDIGAIDPSYLR